MMLAFFEIALIYSGNNNLGGAVKLNKTFKESITSGRNQVGNL